MHKIVQLNIRTPSSILLGTVSGFSFWVSTFHGTRLNALRQFGSMVWCQGAIPPTSVPISGHSITERNGITASWHHQFCKTAKVYYGRKLLRDSEKNTRVAILECKLHILPFQVWLTYNNSERLLACKQ